MKEINKNKTIVLISVLLINILLMLGCTNSVAGNNETQIFESISGHKYLSFNQDETLKFFNFFSNEDLTKNNITELKTNHLYKFDKTYYDNRRQFRIGTYFSDISESQEKSISILLSGNYEEDKLNRVLKLYIREITLWKNRKNTILFDSGTIDSTNTINMEMSIIYVTDGVTLKFSDISLSLKAVESCNIKLSENMRLDPIPFQGSL